VESVDRGQPVTRVTTMNSILEDVTSEPRFRARLMGVFSALALLLAVIGIHAVTSFAISQRTQEFGIRMALGASGGEILRIALQPVVTLTAIGVAIGIAGSLALGQMVRGFLYGVSATDPVSIIGCSLFLALVAILAGLIPARRASRLNPVSVLRSE
jgi:putative ABC transport system permease protein